jgi:hypothetical protein
MNILAVITVDFLHHEVAADQMISRHAVMKNGRYLVTDDGYVNFKKRNANINRMPFVRPKRWLHSCAKLCHPLPVADPWLY